MGIVPANHLELPMMNVAGLALLALLGAQPPATGPATIEGVVVKTGTREPLAGARIQLDRERGRPGAREENEPPPAPGAPPPPLPEFHFAATTGADGRFVIENIPPGEYRLYATRTGGYVPGEYGQRTPTGRGISLGLGPGEKKTGYPAVVDADRFHLRPCLRSRRRAGR